MCNLSHPPSLSLSLSHTHTLTHCVLATCSKHKKLSAALICADESKSQRHTELLLSSIQPCLEQTEQRLTAKIARAAAERVVRLSGDGLSVGYEVYQEDARFIKELLKGEAVANRSPGAVRMGRLEVDAQEALATPRQQPRAAGASAANGEGPLRERPTRPWADG